MVKNICQYNHNLYGQYKVENRPLECTQSIATVQLYKLSDTSVLA